MVSHLRRLQGCPRKLRVYSLYDHLTYSRKVHLVKGSLEHSRSLAVISQHILAVESSLHKHTGVFLKDSIRFDHIALFMAVKQFFRNDPGQLHNYPMIQGVVNTLENNFTVRSIGKNRTCIEKIEEQCREDLLEVLKQE